MAQFTLTVTVSINPQYDNDTSTTIAKNDIHNLMAQWANKYGHSVIVAEDTPEDDSNNQAMKNALVTLYLHTSLSYRVLDELGIPTLVNRIMAEVC